MHCRVRALFGKRCPAKRPVGHVPSSYRLCTHHRFGILTGPGWYFSCGSPFNTQLILTRHPFRSLSLTLQAAPRLWATSLRKKTCPPLSCYDIPQGGTSSGMLAFGAGQTIHSYIPFCNITPERPQSDRPWADAENPLSIEGIA